jgi:hypothetical protein
MIVRVSYLNIYYIEYIEYVSDCYYLYLYLFGIDIVAAYYLNVLYIYK